MAYFTGTDSAKPRPCFKPARCTEITSPSALKTGLPDDPPVVIPSNWIRSAVTRDRIPAVIDVRTMEVLSRRPRFAGDQFDAQSHRIFRRASVPTSSRTAFIKAVVRFAYG